MKTALAAAFAICLLIGVILFIPCIYKKIKYKGWRRITARVVSVETRERPVSDDVSETPEHTVTAAFRYGGADFEKKLPPEYANNAPAEGCAVEILFDPAAERAVYAQSFFDKLPRFFPAVFLCADLSAFLLIWRVMSPLDDGVPAFPEFLIPLPGLMFFIAGCATASRYARARRVARAGGIRPIPAVFVGYRLCREYDDGDKLFALFEYEEDGVKKYLESGMSGRLKQRPGDRATLFRDAETGEVTDGSGWVVCLIASAAFFVFAFAVTAIMLLI